MQEYLKTLWYYIARGEEPLELKIKNVALVIVKEWRVMSEVNACITYI